ncbi:S41 family peptidase [Flavobacterium caseinilyticum]|uniref:Peptidase S41 n=1 Tax=Flavobacterium caseinilyticum TaxID=2541732 RepID=A0A4R5AVX7_9FLAO|nr:S41 family peptidase [Flavobacterium caseinilyticum]TDD76953.1 peptidase S41 [Flavobacterium caseinilyticum]
MKKIILFFFTVLLFVHCTSIKRHNAQLNNLISAEKLKSDVDFTYRKLQELHPKLYWYSSEKDLDYKFDSIKTTITEPMTSFKFFKKLSPVVAAVRQGHVVVYPPTKKMRKKETKALLEKGIGPLSQFDFELFNEKLYVIKNNSHDKSIKIGTEVVTVNGTKPIDLIKEYSHFYSSDGFNTTLKTSTSGKRFSSFFTTANGLKDSLHYNFKYNDSLKTITIRRTKEDTTGNQAKKIEKKLLFKDKAKLKALRKKKRVNGYYSVEKNYNRNLNFLEKDSSVAVLKIRSFKIGDYKSFYRESFAKIAAYNSKALILDLRNNGGGRVTEIADLYSYLTYSTFVFLDKSEVVSKSSLFKGAYFYGGSVGVKALKTIFSPIIYSYILFTVNKKQDGKKYFKTQTKPRTMNKNAFKGKVYVLINGGSFSASSIISSNLKGSKRALFVGEETGGAFNGTVAGFMPRVKLPHSNIQIRMGVMYMAPHFKTTTDGRGIFPDMQIIPTIEDRIKENDPEINWILTDLRSGI